MTHTSYVQIHVWRVCNFVPSEVIFVDFDTLRSINWGVFPWRFPQNHPLVKDKSLNYKPFHSENLIGNFANRSAVDLCTMKMISGLRSSRGAVRAVCSSWVEQCVARNDLGRLVEPLLLSLLDTSTARVSVMHSSVVKQSNVYSIRCGDNKIIYHGDMDQRRTNESPRSSLNSIISSSKQHLQSFEENNVQKSFPYTNSQTWVNPFALVSSESEYNRDPGVELGLDRVSADSSRSASPTSSTKIHHSSSSTPRK